MFGHPAHNRPVGWERLEKRRLWKNFWITLVDFQLDAQILIYLHIIHLLKSSTCFERYPAHLQEICVVIVYMQPLVSSLSAGDCLVHRLRKNCSSFLTGAKDSHLQRVTIPEAAYIQLRRRSHEDEQGNARNMEKILINVLYVNKQEFYASSWRSTKVKQLMRNTEIIDLCS